MITFAAVAGGVVLAGMVAVALHDLIRRPGFRRLALRNLLRRRTETILVIVGSSLGTAIVASALLVGATFHASVRDGARTRLGPIDEQVTVARLDDLGAVIAALEAPRLVGTDGVISTVRAPATVTSVGDDPQTEPGAQVGELDLGRARNFGGHPVDTGLAHIEGELGSHEAVVGKVLADTLGVTRGGSIVVHAFGRRSEFRVRDVVEPVGLAGATDVIVAPGVLNDMAAHSEIETFVAPKGVVLVSNDGRVFDSAAGSKAVVAQIRSRLRPRFDVEITSAKADLLSQADHRGRAMGQLFTGVGTFSVLAGLLLLVNLFVMMGEERKRELGLARATGLTRWHLARVFTLEGLFYAVLAAFVGCFIGIGIAALVVTSATGLVGHGRDDFALRLVTPAGVLVTAGLIGLGLSMATVWITSLRIARLHIVRALRDLPEPPRRHHELRSSLPAGIGVGLGIAAAAWGLVAVVPLAAVLGPPIALCAAIPLLRPVIGRRATTAVACVGTLVWCVGVFTFVPRITDHTGIPVYVVQGVVMVAAAVGLATALDRFWGVGVSLVSRTGRGLAARLGLAYPLEKVFRTGMLVGMYALIVFTLTFVAIYGQVSVNQAATVTTQVAAGADVLVDSNPSNPPASAQVAAVPGVAAVHTVWRAAPQFSTSGDRDPVRWPTSGFDTAMLDWGVPHLSERSTRYPSDRAAFAALAGDPNLIVIPEGFLDTTGLAAAAAPIGVGSQIAAHDPISGRSRTLRVIGVMGFDVTGVGSWMSTTGLRSLAGSGAVANRFAIRLDDHADPGEVTRRLQSDLVANGVEASTYTDEVAESMNVELGFVNLMQRYMSIGLIVGVAGLAVVMVRAGRARRRQIGMLRVLGFSSDTVRGAFLIEAAFIAGQGIATGVGLGLLVSYQMLSRSAALGGDPLPYAVPGVTIAALAFLPFVASLAVALIPAAQASAVDPATVLRLAE